MQARDQYIYVRVVIQFCSRFPGKLFIGGLSHDTDEGLLCDFYNKFGQVVDCIVIREPMTKVSRGFGFVTFAKVSLLQLFNIFISNRVIKLT